MTEPLRLRLPATSANLGPGFDTLALALELYLELEARPANSGSDASGDRSPGEFSIEATGRNLEICSQIGGNLLLQVYRETVRAHAGREAIALAITMRNGIPLGMGCGSSAASRLAGVALAAHFGELGWTGEQVLVEASRLEGHPDNAAACWLGGFVASAWDGTAPTRLVSAISLRPPAEWRALLVLPQSPLATTESRAILPEQYSRSEAVLNLQRVALLTAAFAAGRADLLRAATIDSMHQPYRAAMCPLLPALLPLAGREGILSVTLSGAGPSVLLLLQAEHDVEPAEAMVTDHIERARAGPIELLRCGFASGASSWYTSGQEAWNTGLPPLCR